MKKSSFSKSYDIKTFLNKKKPGSRFFLLTINHAGAGISPGILTFVVFLMVLYYVISNSGLKENLLVYAVKCAVPLCCSDNDDNKPNLGNIMVSLASPVTGFKSKESTLPKINENKKITPKVKISDETVHTNGIEIKNETDYFIDPLSILAQGTRVFPDKPKVLIVHTHGSESYTPDKTDYYEHSGNYRTQNTDFNVIRVGEELAGALREKGIDVIHDKTINDYPSYNDSYYKTEKIIRSHLEKHKDIVLVFDLHRDAVGTEEKVVKFTSEIQGKTAAQVMMVCGTDTNLTNPDWQENLKLAIGIQDYFNRNYPGFLRPINLRKERFNMHLTTGSLLFEVGTNGNSLKEAVWAAKVLGYGLGDFININKKT